MPSVPSRIELSDSSFTFRFLVLSYCCKKKGKKESDYGTELVNAFSGEHVPVYFAVKFIEKMTCYFLYRLYYNCMWIVNNENNVISFLKCLIILRFKYAFNLWSAVVMYIVRKEHLLSFRNALFSYMHYLVTSFIIDKWTLLEVCLCLFTTGSVTCTGVESNLMYLY